MKKSKLTKSDTLCAMETYSPPEQSAHAMPLYATSAFNAGSLEDGIEIFNGSKPGFVYSRYDNPNTRALSEKIAQLECPVGQSAYGFMTASGMAAIDTAIQVLSNSGGYIITQDGLYGASTELFILKARQMNLKLIYTDLNDSRNLEKLLQSQSSSGFIYLETPSNPLLKCVDISQVASLAKLYQSYLVVDNTFATPFNQKPLELGANIVIHSTTKYIAGHGMSTAGAIICTDDNLQLMIEKQIRLSGCFCSAFEAWLTYHGMKTMALRMERQQTNGMKIFQFLKNNDKIAKIFFTGDPEHSQADLIKKQMKGNVPMISFELKGNLKNVSLFFKKIKLITHATTLGDLNTLVLHPDTSSHRNIDIKVKRAEGITESLIRMSIGIENIDDLLTDLDQALDF